MATTETTARNPKDLRYRQQLFPDADQYVFDTGQKGFIPLPIILRKLIKHLTAPELRVLIYLHLRASRHAICYPTLDEIVHELGISARKNLTPHLKSLEAKRLISSKTSAGKRFFLVHDPRVAIRHLAAAGKLSDEDLFEINELLEDLGQTPLSRSSPE